MIKKDNILYKEIEIHQSQEGYEYKYYVCIFDKNGIGSICYEGKNLGQALSIYSNIKPIIENKEIIEIIDVTM